MPQSSGNAANLANIVVVDKPANAAYTPTSYVTGFAKRGLSYTHIRSSTLKECNSTVL